MKVMDHLRLAALTGLFVGIVFGTIDIIARIVVLSFEWFELYQTLLLSSIIFAFAFITIALILIIILKGLKIRANKDRLSLFYVTSAISLLMLLYSAIIVNRFILSDIRHWNDPLKLKVNFLIILTVGVIYILLFIKGRNLILNVMSFFRKENIKNIMKNYLFLIVVFAIASFFIDVYSLNNIPDTTNGGAFESPNVLLISMDTTRADHLSTYGYHLNTSPNIDKLASSSVVFDNAISVSSWTLPAHASVFTGKYPSNHGAVQTYQMLDSDETTLAEILREKGYNTAAFISGPYVKAKYGLGQGFLTYKDRLDFVEYVHIFNNFYIRSIIVSFFQWFNKVFFMVDGERTSEEVNNDVFKWLDKNKDGPFFLFVHYFDPHDPYTLGEEFRERFTNETREYKEVEKTYGIERYGTASKGIVDYMISLYDTEIFYLDNNLGRLFNKLEELELKNNTIIIIFGDHGEEFYDHGGFLHRKTLYEEVINVPLIIYYPQKFEAQRIRDRTSIVNIFPTLLDMLQIKVPEDVDGVSLLPLIKNLSDSEEYVFSELEGQPNLGEPEKQIAISYKGWKLIEVYPEKETLPSSLFFLGNDSKEQKNLYDVNSEKRDELRKYMFQITEYGEKNDFIAESNG
jgi:arylsulfatase A-like enzyme